MSQDPYSSYFWTDVEGETTKNGTVLPSTEFRLTRADVEQALLHEVNTGPNGHPQIRPVRENHRRGSICLWLLECSKDATIRILIGPKAGFGANGVRRDFLGTVALFDDITYTALRVQVTVDDPNLSATYADTKVEMLALQLGNLLHAHRALTRPDGPGNLAGHIGR